MITNDMRNYRNIIKYKVDNVDILFENGDIEKINGEMVRHLFIEKDFDELYFPLINVSIIMKDELFQRINEEIDTVQFRLRIVKNIYDNNNVLMKYELYCNKTFRCFMEKLNIIKDKEMFEDKKRVESESSQNYLANPREFYLFTDDVMKCKKIMNLSVEDAELTDLLIYMFNQCGIEKLLMSKLDNLDRVNNLMLPNGNLIENINFINQNIGLYKKDMCLFFDLDCAYLVDKNSKCTSWRKNEVQITHIHVANKRHSDAQLNGQYINKDRKQTHVFTHTERLEVSNSNILNDQLSGNDMTIINSKENSITNIKSTGTQIGTANTTILNIHSSNKYATEILKLRMKENECSCTMSFVGLDIDLFLPNKEIIVTYEDPELHKIYSGNYRITKVLATLKKDAQELVGEVQLSLKKQE